MTRIIYRQNKVQSDGAGNDDLCVIATYVSHNVKVIVIRSMLGGGVTLFFPIELLNPGVMFF